jgi:hypothetical protein
MNRRPIRPDRIGRIERGFAAIPNRFLHEGFFVSLGQLERALYFFLVLAADRNGVSFYAYDKICSTLAVSPDQYVTARNALIDKDLIAFDGTRFQVLSLPPHPFVRPRPPLTTQDDFEREDPATIRQILRHDLGGRPPRRPDP